MATKIKKDQESKLVFAFSKTNYIILIVGLLVLILGFLLMVGGGSDDPDVFSDALFGFRRLTLAPILILLGFIIEIFAIMYRPKDSD
jgi:fumarate reductase subunit D